MADADTKNVRGRRITHLPEETPAVGVFHGATYNGSFAASLFPSLPDFDFRSSSFDAMRHVSREVTAVYLTDEDMLFGPSWYDEPRMQVARQALAERGPLPEPPLPLE